MPKVHILDVKADLGLLALNGSNHVFLFIVNGINDGLTLLRVGKEHLDLDLGVLLFDGGRDLDAGAAVIIKIKMRAADANEIHVTVKTAVESEIGHLGIDGVVCRVIHDHTDHRLVGKLFGDVDTPGGIAAIVMRNVCSVQINVGGGVGAAKLKIILLCGGQLGFFQGFGIQAGAAKIIVAAILTVKRVPGVRQVDDLPIAADGGGRLGHALDKCPFFIEI